MLQTSWESSTWIGDESVNGQENYFFFASWNDTNSDFLLLSCFTFLGRTLYFTWRNCLACDFRRWVQAVFRFSDSVNYSPCSEAPTKVDLCCQENVRPKADAEPVKDFVVDMSEGMAFEMFGVPTTNDNEVNIWILIEHWMKECYIYFLVQFLFFFFFFFLFWYLDKTLGMYPCCSCSFFYTFLHCDPYFKIMN